MDKTKVNETWNFLIPTKIVKLEHEDAPVTKISIPLHQILTIKPVFDYVVDCIKSDIEQSIIYSLLLEVVDIDTDHINSSSSAAIDSISLKRDYFEKLVMNFGYGRNKSSKNRFSITNTSDCTCIDIYNPNTAYPRYDIVGLCQKYADEWLYKNKVFAVMNFPDEQVEEFNVHVIVSNVAEVSSNNANINIPDSNKLSLYNIRLISNEEGK